MEPNMTKASQHLDTASAEKLLLRYLAIDGVTGKEEKIANAIRDDLIALGVPAASIRFDGVAAKIPLPTQTGNLIVDLPGTKPGARLLFSTHLDTVPLRRCQAACRGRPHRRRWHHRAWR
jgi:tripeptide aminopeptidase